MDYSFLFPTVQKLFLKINRKNVRLMVENKVALFPNAVSNPKTFVFYSLLFFLLINNKKIQSLILILSLNVKSAILANALKPVRLAIVLPIYELL